MERRLLRTCLLAVLVCLRAGLTASAATDAPTLEALKQLVARAHSYPAEKLLVEEQEHRIRGFHDFVDLPLHARFAAKDDSFIRFSIAGGAMNDILPEAERKDFEAKVEAGAKRKGRPSPLRVTRMENGAVVYSGSGMPGKEGSVALMWILFPAKDVGVVMDWTTDNEKTAELEKAPQKYLAMFSEKTPNAEVISAMSTLAQAAVELALETKQPANHSEVPASSAPAAADKASLPARTPSTGRSDLAEFPSLWPWVTGGFILLLLFIIVLKQRSRIR